jgi:hypothetical protein
VLPGTDAGTAAIGLSFGAGAALGGGIGQGAADAAGTAAGLPRRRACRPVMPFTLPPGILTATSVGSYLDLPGQFGPPTGWFWDVLALTAYGFTAGTIAVSKNAPLLTAAGNPYAVEPQASFTQAGILTFSQKGMPLLDSCDRLVFTVTGTLTGQAQISGQVVAIPAERIDEYLS